MISNNPNYMDDQQQQIHMDHNPDESQHNDVHLDDGVLDPDDPLLIAQTLTYITDNGSVVLTYSSAPFSIAFKIRFLILELIFIGILFIAAPIGYHGLVLSVSVGNLLAVAWFWYNSVRSVELTTDSTLRFWIGNVELDVPFDKIVEMRRISGACGICSFNLAPHRGLLSIPDDGVAIITSIPSTPFFMWPRSAGRPERRIGPFTCPRLKIVFSPSGGAMSFIREVEDEMRNFCNGEGRTGGGRIQPPAMASQGDGFRYKGAEDFYDV